MKSRLIECAPDAHAVAVREIFNDAILNTTALYEYQPRSLDAVLQWFGGKARAGHPVLGAVGENDELLGFATYGQFRVHPAYKYSIEHSVYVHVAYRRRGVARLLLQQLIDRAEAQQFHTMIGGIDAANAASIALHEQQGFTLAGTVAQAGYKFGRWLDLAFYQKILNGPKRPSEG